jgi:putative hydrolase of the HAD superfamily
MGAQPTALLLDCLGTLVRLEPPAPRLAAALGTPLEATERAVRAEIAFYRAHMHEAVDRTALADLRRRCAHVVQEHLGGAIDRVESALLDALVFTPYPDTVPALEHLRARGIRLVVVSNWDVSLHEVLDRTGLTPLLDGAVSSAEVGAAKPDPAIVLRGLELAGTTDAWLVGDTEADVGAARAAGLTPILIDRGSGPANNPQLQRISRLTELP